MDRYGVFKDFPGWRQSERMDFWRLFTNSRHPQNID